MRSRFQGVGNIVRFNWHFYALAGVMILVAAGLALFLNSPPLRILFGLAAVGTILSLGISLLVSHWIYDRTCLYDLPWLDSYPGKSVVSISAGFDEISPVVTKKLPEATLQLWDFYDPENHTEVSIERARKAFPPPREMVSISTDSLPAEDDSIDVVCLFMSAHEIRSESERLRFFAEIGRVVRNGGSVYLTEHQRDLPNFLAYTIGFFHFQSKATWRRAFKAGGLSIQKEIRTTPFVTTYILQK